MKLLLDTHSFIWFTDGNPQLSETARRLIADPENEVLLSIVSVWEMAIKVSIGKLVFRQPFEMLLPQQLLSNDIALLDVTLRHAMYVATLPFHHRDPFNRLLIAQSTVEALPLISVDGVFDHYGIHRIW